MGIKKEIDYCFYWNEWGCFRYKECMCGKDQEKNSKVASPESIPIRKQVMEDSIFEEKIKNNMPNKDQFK